MDGIYKHSEQLKFKDEARLNPISDLSIGFYNLDINTSLLTFQVTKQGSPMLLSENHVTAYCILRSSDNKNVSRVLELEITDGMNGILQLQIPNEFLKAVSKPDSIQSVVGQAYLSVNGKEDTVVFSEFNFRVKDAMINQISSEVKVKYIRMFDDLKNVIEDRVNYIEEQIKHGEDYVALMKQTVSSGVKKINSLVDKSKSDINQTVNVYRQDVEDTKTFAISQINSEVDLMNNSISKAKEDIDKSIEQYKSDIKQSRDDVINIATQSQSIIESQVNQGKQDINNLKDESLNSIGDAKDDALDSIQNSTDWQKYKLTEKNGESLTVDLNNDTEKIINLSPGIYYLTNVPSLPTGVNNEGNAISVYKNENSSVIKRQILYMPFNSSDLYIASNVSDFNGWQKVGLQQKDTGWKDLPLLNNVEPDTYSDSYLPVSYRAITHNDVTKVQILGNIKNISKASVFAQIPSHLAPPKTIEYKIYQRIGTSNAVAYITSDGTMKVVGAIEPNSTYMIDLIYTIGG